MNNMASPPDRQQATTPNFVTTVKKWLAHFRTHTSQRTKLFLAACTSVGLLFIILALIVSQVPLAATQAFRSSATSFFLGTTPLPQATVIWQDDFTGASLDASKWSLLKGGRFYTPASQETYTSDNVTVRDGLLNLTSQAQQRDGFPFTSGGISSQGKFSFTYGKIDWRVKFPSGNGLWPAIWLMPEDGQPSYEIDVAEFFGNTPHTLLMNSHWINGKTDNENPTKTAVVDLAADYHTLSLIWQPDELDWFLDGTLRKITTAHIPNKPMFIYMNTAIGSYAGYPDGNTIFPQTFAIDYVRVSKLPTQAGNVLTGKLDVTSAPQDLSTAGTTDWVSWGIATAADSDHKNGTAILPATFTHIGDGTYDFSGGGGMVLTWRDGKQVKDGGNQEKGVTVCGLNNGFGFSVPATQQTQVVRIYVNAWRGRGQLTATLTDKSLPPYTDATLANANGNQSGVYTITFKAATSGQSLLVHWTAADAYINKCVVIQAVTLATK